MANWDRVMVAGNNDTTTPSVSRAEDKGCKGATPLEHLKQDVWARNQGFHPSYAAATTWKKGGGGDKKYCFPSREFGKRRNRKYGVPHPHIEDLTKSWDIQLTP